MSNLDRNLFTERANRVRNQACAQQVTDGGVAMLLALLQEPTSAAVAILRRLAIDIDRVKPQLASVVAQVATSNQPVPSVRDIEETAVSEAKALRHPYVGTEHLLLGITKTQSSTAAEILTTAGAEYARTRTETLRLLGLEPEAGLNEKPTK